MVTISISAEAHRAITGRLPDPSKRDDRGGYQFVLDHSALDRLRAVRGQGESYSDVIIRLAKGDGGEE
jgi:hypothetical protein